jgi:hypothetical protein
MDTMKAFAYGQANRGKDQMVFDWDKAARLIREAKPARAAAGLAGDWEWTGGRIYEEEKPVPASETYTFLASTWAVPQLSMDNEVIPCFRMETDAPGWDSSTYWPDSALKILNGEDE